MEAEEADKGEPTRNVTEYFSLLITKFALTAHSLDFVFSLIVYQYLLIIYVCYKMRYLIESRSRGPVREHK